MGHDSISSGIFFILQASRKAIIFCWGGALQSERSDTNFRPVYSLRRQVLQGIGSLAELDRKACFIGDERKINLTVEPKCTAGNSRFTSEKVEFYAVTETRNQWIFKLEGVLSAAARAVAMDGVTGRAPPESRARQRKRNN